MKLQFREQPGADVDQVQRELRRVLAGVEVARVLEAKTIGTTETRVRHGLDSVPSRWRVASQKGPGVVYETKPPDDKFLYLAALTSFGSAAGAPSELFVRNDKSYCAGVDKPGGPGDDPTKEESAGSAAPTSAYEPYWIAYPEVMRVDCTVVSLAFYSDAGTQKIWVAVFSNASDGAGNDYPGTCLAVYEFSMVGFGPPGAGRRLGVVSLAATAGTKLWFGTATNTNAGLRGYMTSSNYRPVLGYDTPASIVGTFRNYIGIRTATAPAYALPVVGVTTFPAGGVLLPVGNDTIGSGSANTVLRPTIYFGLGANSAAAGGGGSSLVADIEVL